MVATWHDTLVQTHEVDSTRSDPKEGCRLWVMLMHPCRFIICHKCSTSVGMLITGEAVFEWRQGVYGKSLFLLLNFPVNSKCLPKIKTIFLKKEYTMRIFCFSYEPYAFTRFESSVDRASTRSERHPQNVLSGQGIGHRGSNPKTAQMPYI